MVQVPPKYFCVKMNLLICIFIFSVLVMNSEERLLVSGSSRSISASVGEDVTLNCSVDSHISPEHIEQVSWKKTDGDEDIMVLLYENKEMIPEVSHERYRDRVEFFTDQIPKGNFSLRLKSVRTEDKGVYMCQVFAGDLSANATVVLERLGFSVSHILVFIICITASVSALLLCCLIYCRCCNFSNAWCQVVQYNYGFTVKGPYGCQISLGDSVVLPCYVDKCLLKEGLKVEWRRTDSETLVHLYQDGESRAEVQQEDYHDRAHFFTDQIQHGNFSLRLDNLRAEDKGLYRCKVYSGQGCVYSAEADLTLSFTVRSASKFQFVPVGSSVVLPCHVDKCLLKEDGLKVEWKRTTGDSETLVHLYQDGESRPEAQQEDYHDRAHFFTDQIQHGNFSLRLEKVRAEDDGQYTCRVYSGQDCVYSTNTKLILRFDIKRSRHTLAPLGSSVVLPCYSDKPLPMEDLRVEWRRTDSKTLVHLYKDGESRAEQEDENYQDRAHFFTDQIQHGNFSLCLDNLRAEDEGKYTCTVYRNQRQVFSVNKILELRLVDTIFNLQMFLVICPNILMFLAFVLWGVSEGTLFESASCCALYFLRPLMLLWAAPYVNNFTENIKTFIQDYSYETEYIVFSAIFYSVLFKSAWDKSLNYTGFEGAMIIVLFVTVLLLNLFYIIYLFAKLSGKLSKRIIALFKVMARIIFDFLPSLQFIFLFFAFGSARGGFFIVAVLPVFLTVTRYNWDLTCGEEMGCSPSVRRSVWFILMLLVNAIMVYFYIIALENEKGHAGWACMIGFLQLLWAVINFTRSFDFALHRVVPVYLFGSVVVVLLNAVTLMAELILKTLNGHGAVGDLRVVVFSSECLFTLFLMILLVFEPWIKTCLHSCQNAETRSDKTPANESNQNTTESHEMKPLLDEDQEAGRNNMTEENQPDSVEEKKM